MPDNLARKIENPYNKQYNGSNLPDFKMNVNPHFKRINEIKKTIDALLDIRLSLSVKKIVGPTIKKSELNEIIKGTKEKVKDLEVEKEIDKVFAEYLDIGVKTIAPADNDTWSDNVPVLKAGVESKIDDKVLSLEEMKKELESDSGQEKGISKVLTNGYYKNSSNDVTPEA